jgi:hypothetical protein
MSARHVLAYRNPEASERLARASLPLLELLERLNLRRLWSRLSTMLLAHSYLLGLADAMPSLDELRAFIAPVSRGEGAEAVRVELDQTGEVGLPTGHAGWLTLALFWAGTPVATIPAPDPGKQWDWDLLTSRAVEECAAAAGSAALTEAAGLGELSASGLSPRRSR